MDDELTAMPDLDLAILAESLGYREAAEIAGTEVVGESTGLDRSWSDVISRRGYDFCVRWETGGKAYYEGVIKGRPVWPGYASGVTIGCGYDLGYHAKADLSADWGGRIGAADLTRLEGAIGLKTVAPDRDAKIARAKALVNALRDIVVPWTVAIAQFDESKIPKLVAQLYRALDNLDKLHPHCRAALLSLTFNRGGGGFGASGDRYREMREIARLMTKGTTTAIAAIPDQLRAMRRIWGAASSLSQRRKEEAELFEAGLAEARLSQETATLLRPESVRHTETLVESHADVADQTDDGPDTDLDDDRDAEAMRSDSFRAEVAGLTGADVKWNPNDDDQPDYRHLPKRTAPDSFALRADDLVALIGANAFVPKPGLVVFALRGARIEGGDKREEVDEIILSDIRPDHRDFRCVMGVMDRETGRLWAYKASTVPNAGSVLGCYRLAQAGKPLVGNILPTGCYTYTVGTHKAGHPTREIRGVLRLSNAASGASEVVVLRSKSDTVYDRRDFWHKCAPADNIHPGRLSSGFSSEGCLTLPGNYVMASRKHTGLWADFRVALGLGRTSVAAEDGTQFSCVLLTGLDAAIASDLRESGRIADPDIARPAMTRLRFGSEGDDVARMQGFLGLSPDAQKKLGPVTRKALITRQETRLGWADGIWSDEMAALLT